MIRGKYGSTFLTLALAGVISIVLSSSPAFADDDEATFKKEFEENLKNGNTNTSEVEAIANNKGVPDARRKAACEVSGGDFYGGDARSPSECLIKNANKSGKEDAAAKAADGDEKKAEEEASQCSGEYETARLACDPLSSVTGGDSQMLEEVMQAGGQIASQMANIGKGANEMCKSAESLSKKMAGVQGSRAVACKVAKERCVSACETAQKETIHDATMNRKVIADKKKCEGFEGAFQRQLMQTMAYLQNMVQSKSCVEATKTQPPVVATTPTVDCNDANQRRTNPACLCERNPRHPTCMGTTGNPGGVGAVTGGTGSGGTAGKVDGSNMASYGSSEGDGLENNPAGGQNTNASKTGGVPQNGGGGPTPFGNGGGRGFANTDGGSGQSSSGFNTNMMSVGGGAGGGFAGYGKPGGSGSGGGGGSSLMNKLKSKFNLKDALPDKDKLARSLAGMSKDAAADGITGAMGESIWQKATRQYKNQERRGGFIPTR